VDEDTHQARVGWMPVISTVESTNNNSSLLEFYEAALNQAGRKLSWSPFASAIVGFSLGSGMCNNPLDKYHDITCVLDRKLRRAQHNVFMALPHVSQLMGYFCDVKTLSYGDIMTPIEKHPLPITNQRTIFSHTKGNPGYHRQLRARYSLTTEADKRAMEEALAKLPKDGSYARPRRLAAMAAVPNIAASASEDASTDWAGRLEKRLRKSRAANDGYTDAQYANSSDEEDVQVSIEEMIAEVPWRPGERPPRGKALVRAAQAMAERKLKKMSTALTVAAQSSLCDVNVAVQLPPAHLDI
tara:strand:- start:454 stop:1350 length:897 start_codon:yes stop_codon:yes gene_type:complete